MRHSGRLFFLFVTAIWLSACSSPGGSTNKAPVASGQTVTTSLNTAKLIELVASDADGDPLSFKVVTQPGKGQLGTLQGNKLTYTPSTDFTGSDSFTFSANDAKADSNIATVTITVTSGTTNTPPEAISETLEVSLSGELAITLKASDADGDSLEFGALDKTGTKGTVQEASDYKASGKLNYKPSASAKAGDTDSFKFEVSDGTDTVTGTITLTILGAETFVTVANTLLEAGGISPSGNASVQNPTKLASTVSAEDKATTEGGKVSIKADGSFSYAPKKNFVGTDSFTYTSQGKTETAQITVKDANPNLAGNQVAYYVKPGATGGDGTSEKPFGTLFAAEFFSIQGDVIVLHAGNHAPASELKNAFKFKSDQSLLGQNVDVVINEMKVLSASTTETVINRSGETSLLLAVVDATDKKNIIVSDLANNVTIKGVTLDRSNGAGATADTTSGVGTSGIALSDQNTGVIRIEDVKINYPGGFGITVAETDRCFSAENCDPDFNNPTTPPSVGTATARYSMVLKNITVTSPGNTGIAINDPIQLDMDGVVVTNIVMDTIGVAIESEHSTIVNVSNSKVSSANTGVKGFDFHSNNTFDRTSEDAVMVVTLDGNEVSFTRTDTNDTFPAPSGDGNVDGTIAFRARALDNRVIPATLVTTGISAGSSTVKMSGKFNNKAIAADTPLNCEGRGDPVPVVECDVNIFPIE